MRVERVEKSLLDSHDIRVGIRRVFGFCVMNDPSSDFSHASSGTCIDDVMDFARRAEPSMREMNEIRRIRFEHRSSQGIAQFPNGLVDVSRVPFETELNSRTIPQNRCRSTHMHHDRLDDASIGIVDGEPASRQGSWSSPENDLDQKSETTARADEKSTQIETTHILDRRTSGCDRCATRIEEHSL